MGNGTKVALVALLILLVVVVARFVKDDAAAGAKKSPDVRSGNAGPEKAGAAKGSAGKVAGAGASGAAKDAPGLAPKRDGGAAGASRGPAGPGAAASRTGGSRDGATVPSQVRPAVSGTGQAAAPASGASGTAAGSGSALLSANAVRDRSAPPSSSFPAASSSGGNFVSLAPSGGTTEPPGGFPVIRTQTPPRDGPVDGPSNGTSGAGAASGSGAGASSDRAISDPAVPPISNTLRQRLVDEARGSNPGGLASTSGSSPAATSGALTLGAGGAGSFGVRDSERLPSGELVTSSTALRPATDRFAPAAGESGRDAPAGSTPPLASGGFPRSYVIQKGDSFWGIAQKVYGDGSLLALIQKANPGVKMQPGKTLTLPAPTRPASDAPIAPESAALRSANPGRAAGSARDNTQGARSTAKPSRPGSPAPASPAASPPAREGGAILYEVKAGDTLRGLAQRFYGDPSKFTLIEEANEDLKYTMLRSGQRIRVPGPTR